MSLKLKYLEIEDFKTYYGKHVFGPLPSFTAVIGPNGGGKSNILDAIAFVLGERLTALRVKKGKQLIHREKAVDDGEGDDAATASVTAVFSLPDGSEKAFKRVMSSQGSEFLVDGTEVSFSTYQKRLQELGINLLCRNFIVFQGSVESIAMYGSNEKVKMFEEISGSSALKTEYNHLRKEMARAEEEMTADFEKLNMVVSQYHDLKLDRRQEQKYEELEKEYKREKIKLQLFRLYHIGTAQESLQGEVEVKEQALKELKEKGKKQAENLEEKRKNQTVIVQEMGSMEQNVGELEIQLSKKRSELVTVKDCLAERMKKKNICSNLLAKAKDAQDDQLRKLEDLKKELEKTEILAAQFEKRLAEEALKMGKSVQLEGEQLKKYHQLKQQVGQCCVTLQQKVDYLSRQLKTQLDQLANENRRMEERQEALRRKQEEVQDLKKRIERLTANLKLKKESLAEKQQVLKDMQKEVICKRDRVKRLQNELETLTDELNEATWDVNQIQRHTKKREVLEMLREKFPGIYDRLKNLCQPIHPKYHLAITRVLFKHLDSIVVDNEVTARRCINYLCDQRIDRETFLPLNYLQVHPVRESLRAIQDPQNVKLAFDLIKFEPPEVKMAVLFATNDILVCDTPEDAMKVAYEIDERRLSAVALDGTFFSKSGLVSGGKLDLEKKAKCWSEKNVAKMRSKKNTVMGELRELQKVAREESEIKILEVQVHGQEAQVKYVSLELDHFHNQIEELEEQQRKMEEELMIHTDLLETMQAATTEHEMEILK
ncbi:structural maintenance of chromosomes protein 1A-like isoform X1 [Scylla paramamosain]|uniref:structural maintenance of chromosomes protein 1A-like isoform X1 n=1 Tax=Scylla paramamosain TaxID=85552 RepID=UPI003083D6D1